MSDIYRRAKGFILPKKKRKKSTTFKCKTHIFRRRGERSVNMVKMEQNWTSISYLNWTIRRINLDTWHKIRTLIRNSNLSFSLLHLLLYIYRLIELGYVNIGWAILRWHKWAMLSILPWKQLLVLCKRFYSFSSLIIILHFYLKYV